ncbi:MAG: alpha/beta hydrolase [Planctomycetales bacterium]|nr:alpha/beta hydrolase [bacterium]UNM07323.1 MAG: alpha/beta hydrolase [Planctomycetales bacterium]
MKTTITIVLLTASLVLALAVASLAKPGEDELEINRGISYKEAAGSAAKLTQLDIYAPKDAKGLPVVMMVHGGGWAIGDKGNPGIGTVKPAFFCREGFVYVTVNYRLSPAVEHPAHIEDVAAAFAWLVDNVEHYGGDPQRINIMGHSAGAHLVALLGTDKARLAPYGLAPTNIESVTCLDGAGYDIPTRLSGIVGRQLREMMTTAFGEDGSKWADASPTLHVRADGEYPPFLILHTDRPGGASQSMGLGDALRKAGGYAFNREAGDKSHRTVNADVGRDGDWLTELVLDFLDDQQVGD